MSRRPWTQQQDQCIKKLVQSYGTKNWTLISQKIQFDRSGKQCRQRWHNHLDPHIDLKSWTEQEQLIIFEAHQKCGNRWKDISKLLPGRTDNTVKNHFYSTLRRSLRRINKILGNKNSTNKMRKIKPLVLAQIMQNNELPKVIFRFGKLKPTRHSKQIIVPADMISFDQMIQKLLVINDDYQQLKRNQKFQLTENQSKTLNNVTKQLRSKLRTTHKRQQHITQKGQQQITRKGQPRMTQKRQTQSTLSKISRLGKLKRKFILREKRQKKIISLELIQKQKEAHIKSKQQDNQMDINDQQSVFQYPMIPEISLEQLNSYQFNPLISNTGSFTDLCVIGTHMHLFQTPRHGRTMNIGSMLMSSQQVQETLDEQGQSMIIRQNNIVRQNMIIRQKNIVRQNTIVRQGVIVRQSHRKSLTYQSSQLQVQSQRQKQSYIEQILQMNYSQSLDQPLIKQQGDL